MTLSDLHPVTSDAACPVCEPHGPVVAPPARISPLRLVAGVARAAAAVGSLALASCAGPDPIHLQPRVLRQA